MLKRASFSRIAGLPRGPSSGSIPEADTLDYVADLALQLGKLASPFPTVAALLNAAHQEALHLLEQKHQR